MLAILYIFSIFLGLIFDKSKIIRYYQFFMIWILFAFNTMNADMDTYRLIYQGYYGDVYEPGFNYWKNIFSDIMVDFDTFRFISVSIVVWAIFRISRDLFNEIHNRAISLLMMFPFLHMVIILRNSLAIAIVLVALTLYFKSNTCFVKDKVKYTLLIMIAACFHYSAAFFLIFLFMKNKANDIENIVKISLILAATFIVVNSSIFGSVLQMLFYSTKVLSWFEDSNRIGDGYFLVAGLHIMELFIVLLANKCHDYKPAYDDDRSLLVERRICSMNAYSMLLLGFYTINMNFFTRIYSVVIILNTINISHLLCRFSGNKYAVCGMGLQMLFLRLFLECYIMVKILLLFLNCF